MYPELFRIGDFVVSTFGLMLALAFLVGGWAIAVWIRRTRRPQSQTSEPASAKLDPEAESRLKAELAELESSI